MTGWARRLSILAVLLLAGLVTGRVLLEIVSGDTEPAPVGAAAAADPPSAPAPARVGRAGPGPPHQGDGPRQAVHPETGVALEALQEWDRRRAAAYRRGDAIGLRRLYVAGSRSAAADARVLAGYAARGLRVIGMRMQVLSVRVLSAQELPGRRHRLRVAVTDRLLGVTAVGSGVRRALPRDAPTRHLVVLERRSGRWRVAAVHDR